MNRVGIGPDGRILIGWDHVASCIGIILSTELGSRVQRRDYGSLLPRLVDQPQNQETVVNFYMAAAEALEPRKQRGRWYGEPGFKLDRCLLDLGTAGEVSMTLVGTYFPRGHLGDFSISSPKTTTYSVNRLFDVIELAAAG